MSTVKLCKTEAIALIIVATINQVILGAPKSILLSNGSSALFNTVTITLVAILFVLILSNLFNRFQNSDIIDVSEFLGGKILKTIISIAYIVLFFIITTISIRYITEFLKIIYFRNSSIILLTFFLLSAMVFAVQKGIKTISKVNILSVILSFFTLFILLVGSTSKFIPEMALPVFGYGIEKTFLINLSNVFAFSGISYLMFIMPLLKNTKEFKQITILSVIISSIYLFISVLCLLLVFSFMTVTQDLFSVFLLTRIIEYSPILERTDAIFIFFWLFCVLSFLSINLYFIIQSFGKLTKLKNPKSMAYSIGLLILGITIIVTDVSQYYLIYDVIFPYYFIILFLISILILFFANIKKKK